MMPPRNAHTAYTQGCKTVSDRDLVAKPVSPIAMDKGLAIPCRSSDMGQFKPGADAATLVFLVSWVGDKGLYQLWTPEGARDFAAALIAAADNADIANAEMTATALSRITGKGGEA